MVSIKKHQLEYFTKIYMEENKKNSLQKIYDVASYCQGLSDIYKFIPILLKDKTKLPLVIDLSKKVREFESNIKKHTNKTHKLNLLKF